MPFVHHHRTLALRAGATRLGILSDTHSRPHPSTLELLAAESPDALLHAGDIGDLACLEPFEALAPMHVVRGNIDPRTGDHPDAITLDLVDDTGTGRLRLLITHIAVQGRRLRREIRELARTEKADMVVCGHSHMPLLARDGQVVVFNPGSCGPRRFALPIAFGVFDISQTGAQLRHIDCETGEKLR